MTSSTVIQHLNAVARDQLELLQSQLVIFFDTYRDYRSTLRVGEAADSEVRNLRRQVEVLHEVTDPLISDYTRGADQLHEIAASLSTIIDALDLGTLLDPETHKGVPSQSAHDKKHALAISGIVAVLCEAGGLIRACSVVFDTMAELAPNRPREVTRGQVAGWQSALQSAVHLFDGKVEPEPQWVSGLKFCVQYLKDPAIGEAEARVLVRSVTHWLVTPMFTRERTQRSAVEAALKKTSEVRETLKMSLDDMDPAHVPTGDLTDRAAGRFAASLQSAAGMTVVGRLQAELAEAKKKRPKPKATPAKPPKPFDPSKFRMDMKDLAKEDPNVDDVVGRPTFDFDQWVTPGDVIQGMKRWAAHDPTRWDPELVYQALGDIEADFGRETERWLTTVPQERLDELGRWANLAEQDDVLLARGLEASAAPYWYRYQLPEGHKFKTWNVPTTAWGRYVQSSVSPYSVPNLRLAIAKTVLYAATPDTVSLERMSTEPKLAVRLRGKLGKTTMMRAVRKLVNHVQAAFNRGPDFPQGTQRNAVGFDSRFRLEEGSHRAHGVTWIDTTNRDPVQVRYDQIAALFDLMHPMIKEAHDSPFGEEHRTKLDAMEIWFERARDTFDTYHYQKIRLLFSSEAQNIVLAEWEQAARVFARRMEPDGLLRSQRDNVGRLQVAFEHLYKLLQGLHLDVTSEGGIEPDIGELYDETLWIDFIFDGLTEHAKLDEIDPQDMLAWANDMIRLFPDHQAQVGTPIHTKLYQRLERVLDAGLLKVPSMDPKPYDPGDYVPPKNNGND